MGSVGIGFWQVTVERVLNGVSVTAERCDVSPGGTESRQLRKLVRSLDEALPVVYTFLSGASLGTSSKD